MTTPTERNLPPMEQLLAFCDWEHQQQPHKQHIAEWARDEMYRQNDEIALLTGTLESRDRNIEVLTLENMLMQGELSALRKQEPVANVTVSQWRGLENIEWQEQAKLPDGTHLLYLAAGAQQVAVPQGWQLAPTDPDDRMTQAAIDEAPLCVRKMYSANNSYTGEVSSFNTEGCADIYRAMLAAAPQPPQPSNISAEVIAFLNGAGPLDGVWFGEDHPTERGKFWWRKHLVSVAPKPPQAERVPPASPCSLTDGEYKIFKLGWLECEAHHGIGAKP